MIPPTVQCATKSANPLAPHPIAYALAVVLFIPIALLSARGFGRYISYFAPSFLFFVFVVIAICLAKSLRWGTKTSWALMPAALVAGYFIGGQIRLFQCRKIEEQVAPIIRALDQRKAISGAYPTVLSDIPEARNLGSLVRQDKFLKNGISTSGIDTAPATFYLAENKYACVIPIEKPLPISITGFHLYRYLSDAPHWEKDYLVWMIQAM